jgi:hypothetical protein
MGFDQPEKTQTLLPSPPLPGFGLLPRDALLNPLMVVLPGVKPGNFLEIDYLGGFINQLSSPPPDFALLGLLAVVNFAGITAPAAPASGWSGAVSSTGAGSSAVTGNLDTGFNVSSKVLVEIPDGATDAVVQIAYLDLGAPGGYSIGGTDSPLSHPGFTLKASEWTSNVIAQPGPSFLLPF